MAADIPLLSCAAGESHPLRIGAAALRDVRHLIRGLPATGGGPGDLCRQSQGKPGHGHLGLPFKRIESFQRLLGMPLPDTTTQWELVEQVAGSAYPVYEQLKRLGAQQPLLSYSPHP
jgi:hypothetical protein